MALNKIKKMCLIAVTAMFAACGDEVTEVTEVTQVVGMQVVEEGDALPKCNTENEGQMVYSVDSAAAYTCVSRKWVSMKGKDGKDGENGTNGTNGTNGSSCTAQAIDGGYKIVCGGDSVGVVLNGAKGENGTNGTNGINGTNGTSCTAEEIDGGYKIVCGGDSVGVVLNGAKGENGTNGTNGINGTNGTSCTAEEIDGGYKIVCGGDSVGVVLNGKDGKDGADGKSVSDGVMIDPRDKQIYKVVAIGEQTWMAENLNYADSVKTPSLLGRSWCFKNNLGNCTKYGRLYTWAAAIDSAKLYKDKSIDCGYDKTCSLPDTVYGICPPGWHLPDKTEWNKLFTAVGGREIAGKMLKSQTGWNDYNGIRGNGTDAYGFSAFPASWGYDMNIGFGPEGYSAYFWCSAEVHDDYFDDDYNAYYIAYYMFLISPSESASLDVGSKINAYSVRCLKN